MNPHLPLIHTLLHNSLLAALTDVESYSYVVELRVLSSSTHIVACAGIVTIFWAKVLAECTVYRNSSVREPSLS